MAKKKVVKEENSKKAKLEAEKKKMEKKAEGFWKEFKKFITRGNVIDMSIGVVIGGAFGAVVTAMTNILLNVCTWGVPGGLKGIITILPAANPEQAGLTDIGQSFSVNQLSELIAQGFSKDELLAQYTLHGNTYIYNGAAFIDWGTFINAIISFLIIALTLFVIIKVFTKLQKKSAEMHAKALEEYYKKHPEARPAPVAPGIPEPTDHQLLKGILAELQAQNKTNKTKKK